MRDLRAQKASFSDLRSFAGFAGRLRAFCGRFAGNSGRGRRETVPILDISQKYRSFTSFRRLHENNIEIYKKQVKAETYIPGNSWKMSLQVVPLGVLVGCFAGKSIALADLVVS